MAHRGCADMRIIVVQREVMLHGATAGTADTAGTVATAATVAAGATVATVAAGVVEAKPLHRRMLDQVWRIQPSNLDATAVSATDVTATAVSATDVSATAVTATAVAAFASAAIVAEEDVPTVDVVHDFAATVAAGQHAGAKRANASQALTMHAVVVAVDLVLHEHRACEDRHGVAGFLSSEAVFSKGSILSINESSCFQDNSTRIRIRLHVAPFL